MTKEEHQQYVNWVYAIHGIKKGTSEDAPSVSQQKERKD